MIRKANQGQISDWEFTAQTLPDGKQVWPVNNPTCLECHLDFATRGFISLETEGAVQSYLQLK